MAANCQKDKLIFAPHYLGSLKYFEKLLPFLEKKYQVVFLFLPQTRQEFKEKMVAYCQEKKYDYQNIQKYCPAKATKTIPLLSALLLFFDFRKKIKNIIADPSLKKLVLPFDTGPYYYYLGKKAKEKNIIVMVLQWSLTSTNDLQKKKIKFEWQLKKNYSFLNNLLLDWLSGNRKSLKILGSGSAQKFGLINQMSQKIFQEYTAPKKKILIVPHYLGSLKYLEKLILPLKEKYEVFFLFTPKVKEKSLSEIIKYCQAKNYPYLAIQNPPCPDWLRKIPFFYHPLLTSLVFRWKIKKLLQDQTIQKIITTCDTNFYHNWLLKKANQKKIETIVLQWSITIERNRSGVKPAKSWLKKIYRWFFNQLMPRMNETKTLGLGQSQKFGVASLFAFQEYQKWKTPSEKMTIVGSLDFNQAETIQKKLNQDPLTRKNTEGKLDIDTAKKNIVIFSSPFNKKDVLWLSDQEQLEYFEKIVKIIREVFNEKEADILFKIHPIEDKNLYLPLQKLGVKVYNSATQNEELVYFADLYIGHGSTANFIPMIMQKPIIFINFIKWPLIDLSQKTFNAKKFIKDYQEFRKLLQDFKNNRLEKQYELTDEIYTPHSLEKILAWIN